PGAGGRTGRHPRHHVRRKVRFRRRPRIPRTRIQRLRRAQTRARQLEIYRDALKHELKPFPAELSIRKDIYIAENRGKAWEEAEHEVPKLMQGFNAEKQYQELPADDGYDETQDLKTFIRSRYIVGNPSDCIEQIKAHR